jgi:hypothetical protein
MAARRRLRPRPAPRPRLRPRAAGVPRAASGARPGTRWSVLVLLLALVTLAFLAGWVSRPPESPEPWWFTASVPLGPLALADTCTSTVGLCPCPRPKAERTRRIPRRPTPPRPPGEAARPDPTAATAAYLRDAASAFAPCAPSRGAALRVHLEVTVAPDGRLSEARVTNLEPLPDGVRDCALEVLGTLRPPGFDGAEPESFGLTVVL